MLRPRAGRCRGPDVAGHEIDSCLGILTAEITDVALENGGVDPKLHFGGFEHASAPKSLWKNISTTIEEAYQSVREPARIAGGVGKLTYKLSRDFGFVEFYSNKNMDEVTHSVDFTDEEKRHLANGGTIVIVHGCGKEAHITAPNPFRS